MITTLLAAAAAFVATNIDDVFLLTIYFTQVNQRFSKRHIILGQFLGFGAILAVSAVGYFGALFVPEAWIGFLGVVPIYLGLKRLLQKQDTTPVLETGPSVEQPSAQKPPLLAAFVHPQTYGVAAVTFANGGDNISVYIPLFAGQSILGIGAILVVFGLMLAMWCYLGYVLGSHPVIARLIQRYEAVLIPLVLIGLGCFILLESGSLALLTDLFTSLNP